MVAFAALVNDGSHDFNVFTAWSDDGDSWTFGEYLSGIQYPGPEQQPWIRSNIAGTAWIVASFETYTSPDAKVWSEVAGGAPYYGDLWTRGLQWCEYSAGLGGWLASPPFEDSTYDVGGFVSGGWIGNFIGTGVIGNGWAYTYDGTVAVVVAQSGGNNVQYGAGSPIDPATEFFLADYPLGWGDGTGVVQTPAGWLAVSSVVGPISSTDAVTWAAAGDGPTALGVRWLGSRYVTWESDSIVWSADGSTWNTATIPDTVNGICDVAYSRGVWVAAFDGSDGCFIRSTNLDDWALVSGPPGFATLAYSVDGGTGGIPPTRQYPRADLLALGAARQAQAGSNAPSSVQGSARQGYANTFS